VEQELLIFLSKHSDRLDDDYNIEPYLIKTAQNIALAYQRKFAFYGTEGEDSRVERAETVAGPEEEEAGDLAEVMDQQAALEYLLSQSSALRAIKEDKEAGKPMNIQHSNTSNTDRKGEESGQKYIRSAQQDALRNLRLQFGLSQGEMASRLGLKITTYQAYEYARTKGVPDSVMEAARNLSIDPEHSYVMALYGNRPMRDIALEWSKRMGIAPDSPVELAKALGIDKSNTSRWLDPEKDVRLTAEDLLKYERRVAEEERYFKASQQRRRQLHD
jgi:transcriptional regulator with XRE-family HTH domain